MDDFEMGVGGGLGLILLYRLYITNNGNPIV